MSVKSYSFLFFTHIFFASSVRYNVPAKSLVSLLWNE